MKLIHKFTNGQCEHCGCKSWQGAKPCKSIAAKPSKRERESRNRDYAPGSGEYNDMMFGTSND